MPASCDRTSVTGVRDFAVLTLLARMGLRVGEVAGLGLDDINWRGGELAVAGKGGHTDRLPLPSDVGEAVVAYLRHARRPDALDRQVFICVRAPHHGLTATAVTQAVAAAAHRAGLGTVYAHWLRHPAAATSMLAAGASLTGIGQVLRHRGPLTTWIYAKADTAALRTLARGEDPLFPSIRGGPLSPDALAQRVAVHAATAAASYPPLTGKNVTRHVLRHTAAMRLLHAGVETTVIALWLGHENVTTARIYLEANLELKQRALDRTAPTATPAGRYRPPDQLIAFLEAL